MPRPARRLALALCVLALAGAACTGSREAPPAPGAVVESAAPLGAVTRAGLRPGDVLLAWQRGSSGGPLSSCIDAARVETEEAPRGAVSVRRLRGAETATVVLPPGEWQVELLPRSGRTAGGDACRAWARARRLTREKRWPEARAAWEEAARLAGRGDGGPGGRFAARVLQEQGVFLTVQDDFAAAEAALRESLRRAGKGGLAEAAAWHALGRLEQRRAAYGPSVDALRRALELRTRLAPESLERAATLNNLGIDAWYQGDAATARSFYLQALALIRRRAPGSQDEGKVFNNLGLLARDASELATAVFYFEQSRAVWRRFDPESLDMARTLDNLAILAADRGEIAAAEAHDQEALRLFETLAPGSLEVANALSNLGMIARERFDLPESEALFRRALDIHHRLVPGSADEARSLSNLGWVLQEMGRLDEAERYVRQALAIRSRLRPGGPEVALSLGILGGIANKRGDLRTAESLAGQALALQRRVVPGSILESDTLDFLGNLALAGGRYAEAEALARQSLDLRRHFAPGSRLVAEELYLIGQSLWKRGRTTEAAAAFAAAMDALESQIGRLGGTDESRSGFEAVFAHMYQDPIALDVERGDAAAALRTLERWRGRMLLAQIAERQLAFRSDVPAALADRQRELDRDYQALQARIASGRPEAGATQALLVRLSRLRNERSALVERIVRASPRYASLRYPRPLDLAGVRRALDPGTVWLSYSVAEDAAFLFVVTPPGTAGTSGDGEGVHVVRLAVEPHRLAEDVSMFRGLILRGRGQPRVEEALRVQARRLYGLLVAPAEPWIAHADRILISPDGPLAPLPFAALMRPEGGYLVEWKPVHTVLSATLYAELKRGRRGDLPPGRGPLVAFADPLLRPVPGARALPDDPPLRRYRAGLPPLPGAREEVAALAAVFGPDARIYTGADASEARLASLPVRPRYLHIASHALFDRRFPLDSALALAPSPADDPDGGLLQAWEILERLRFDADLVTLSACGTGLGRDAGGEGLIGLTRAFQYAGARSVLASLWAVSDRSTPALMGRFYRLLREGKPKDEALAEAQRALLRDPRLAHPYSWAAFELNGDWR